MQFKTKALIEKFNKSNRNPALKKAILYITFKYRKFGQDNQDPAEYLKNNPDIIENIANDMTIIINKSTDSNIQIPTDELNMKLKEFTSLDIKELAQYVIFNT